LFAAKNRHNTGHPINGVANELVTTIMNDKEKAALGSIAASAALTAAKAVIGLLTGSKNTANSAAAGSACVSSR
jgi:hypothetical protein